MHSHSHTISGHSDEIADSVPSRIRVIIWSAVGLSAALVVIGLFVLWPSTSDSRFDPRGLQGDPIDAQVTADEVTPCSFDGTIECRQIDLVIGDRDAEPRAEFA